MVVVDERHISEREMKDGTGVVGQKGVRRKAGRGGLNFFFFPGRAGFLELERTLEEDEHQWRGILYGRSYYRWSEKGTLSSEERIG